MNLDLVRALSACKIIDISQPISAISAVFPGDQPFSRQVTMTFAESKLVNLSAFTMSPHVGTHADAPSHLRGTLEDYREHDDCVGGDSIGFMPLNPYVGEAIVIDLAPFNEAVTFPMVAPFLEGKESPRRLLLRTQLDPCRYQYPQPCAYLSVGLVDELAAMGVELVGIDTPSVDEISAAILCAHQKLMAHEMSWLENLDLSQASAGTYFLIALPLKFMELEASPVRAVLLV